MYTPDERSKVRRIPAELGGRWGAGYGSGADGGTPATPQFGGDAPDFAATASQTSYSHKMIYNLIESIIGSLNSKMSEMLASPARVFRFGFGWCHPKIFSFYLLFLFPPVPPVAFRRQRCTR